ncbi:beta-1,3-galactosyltransferase 5 [Tachyglossus aculeatus]|uniref:beta-1,3-galactosyltransferase 5 n=1 Tax=Tachyglossus aculeatus TaxID=9261 RepID=UPI0018F2DC89|nr:beta-1,3-galactosyltransferase 5 [Tachyglossus aculeatus]
MACWRFKVKYAVVSVLAVSGLCFFMSKLTLMEILGFPKNYAAPPLFKRDISSFIQLPEIDCRESPPFLVVLVTSTHNQMKARNAIRDTWGRERMVRGKRIRTFFLLGITANPKDESLILQEGEIYRDIIQKDFIDVYYNLTLKTMMGIEWVHSFCPQSDFVMKTDSDMFVNVYYLIELLLKKNKSTRFFTGFLKMNEFPIRKIFNKWYVSTSEYPGTKYPPFCSGTGYVFSSDVASQVYNVSERVPFLKLEDVFVGLCLAELKIELEELHWEQTFFPDKLSFSPCRFKKIVTSHFMKPHELLMFWKALEEVLNQECH